MNVSKAIRTSFYLQSFINLKFYLNKNAVTLIVLELLTTENPWNFVS